MLGVLFNEGKAFMGMVVLSESHGLIITRKNDTHTKVTETSQVVSLTELKSLKKLVDETIFEMEIKAEDANADQPDNS